MFTHTQGIPLSIRQLKRLILHKGAFRDSLCLRYNWRPSHLPSHCVCGSSFHVSHALSCTYGGFPSVRHNEQRNLTAHFLTEVCQNVCIEPELQPLNGERIDYTKPLIRKMYGARLYRAMSFWNSDRQDAFFDMRVLTFRHLPTKTTLSPPVTGRMSCREEKSLQADSEDGGTWVLHPSCFLCYWRNGSHAQVFCKKLVCI